MPFFALRSVQMRGAALLLIALLCAAAGPAPAVATDSAATKRRVVGGPGVVARKEDIPYIQCQAREVEVRPAHACTPEFSVRLQAPQVVAMCALPPALLLPQPQFRPAPRTWLTPPQQHSQQYDQRIIPCTHTDVCDCPVEGTQLLRPCPLHCTPQVCELLAKNAWKQVKDMANAANASHPVRGPGRRPARRAFTATTSLCFWPVRQYP